jgi:hypothetical protein
VERGEFVCAFQAPNIRLTLDTLAHLGRGLETLHDARGGHLDLQPANVYMRKLRSDGSIVPALANLWFSKSTAGGPCGTAAYKDPVGADVLLCEPSRGARRVRVPDCNGARSCTVAADMVSLACIATELWRGRLLTSAELSGEEDFVADTVSLRYVPRNVLAIISDFRDLVMECYSMDPAKRPLPRDFCERICGIKHRLEQAGAINPSTGALCSGQPRLPGLYK